MKPFFPAYFNLGTLEYEIGDPKIAKDYFIKYLKANPNDIEAREFLFDIFRKEKNEKSAYEQALKILDKNPGKNRGENRLKTQRAHRLRTGKMRLHSSCGA